LSSEASVITIELAFMFIVMFAAFWRNEVGNVSISDNVLYYAIMSYRIVKSTAWDNRIYTIITADCSN